MKQKVTRSPAPLAKRGKTETRPAGRVVARKSAARATTSGTPPPAAGSKQERCLDLLTRRDGAILAELIAATDWQAHSVRGFLSGTVKKKLGHTIVSSRDNDGALRYRIDRTGRGR